MIERPLGRVKKHGATQVSLAARKTVVDEFMLKEYESIAAAHFDSQSGLRQQFRFYLVLAAVPLTILGLAFKESSGDIERFNILKPPVFLADTFFAVGVLGVLMLLAMIHTAMDATLYARTVNGVRGFFSARGNEFGTELAPYLLMPIDMNKPKYFRIRSFFWQVVLIAAVNTAYTVVPAFSIWPVTMEHTVVIPLSAFVAQLAIFRCICWLKERQKT